MKTLIGRAFSPTHNGVFKQHTARPDSAHHSEACKTRRRQPIRMVTQLSSFIAYAALLGVAVGGLCTGSKGC